MAILLACTSLVAGASDANPLLAEQWRTRPLVVVAPSADLTATRLALRQPFDLADTHWQAWTSQ